MLLSNTSKPIIWNSHMHYILSGRLSISHISKYKDIMSCCGSANSYAGHQIVHRGHEVLHRTQCQGVKWCQGDRTMARPHSDHNLTRRDREGERVKTSHCQSSRMIGRETWGAKRQGERERERGRNREAGADRQTESQTERH